MVAGSGLKQRTGTDLARWQVTAKHATNIALYASIRKLTRIAQLSIDSQSKLENATFVNF